MPKLDTPRHFRTIAGSCDAGGKIAGRDFSASLDFCRAHAGPVGGPVSRPRHRVAGTGSPGPMPGSHPANRGIAARDFEKSAGAVARSARSTAIS